MRCDRCGRAMAYEQFLGNQEHFWGWRCIFCGEIVDNVIIENQRWVEKGIASVNKETIPIRRKIKEVLRNRIIRGCRKYSFDLGSKSCGSRNETQR